MFPCFFFSFFFFFFFFFFFLFFFVASVSPHPPPHSQQSTSTFHLLWQQPGVMRVVVNTLLGGAFSMLLQPTITVSARVCVSVCLCVCVSLSLCGFLLVLVVFFFLCFVGSSVLCALASFWFGFDFFWCLVGLTSKGRTSEGAHCHYPGHSRGAPITHLLQQHAGRQAVTGGCRGGRW